MNPLAGVFPRPATDWSPSNVVSSIFHDVLNRLGIRDRWEPGSAQLTRIHDDDIFLVSVPRSGSNWTRLLLAYLKAPGQSITFDNVDRLIPSLHSSKAVHVDAVPRPRIVKTHFAAYARYPRFLYVARDPRDVMVSWYQFLVSIRQIEATYSFSRFIRSNKSRWPLDWHRHVNRALDIAERESDRAFVVQYERLKTDTHRLLGEMADFCGLDASPSAIDYAIAQCAIDKLRKMEEEHKPRPDFRGSFFRSGETRQWPEWFDDQDLRWFQRRNGQAMERLGYL